MLGKEWEGYSLNKAKIDKYIEYGTTKLKILYKEKKMNFEGKTVKYILETSKNNNDLIVVFSGIPRQGLKARYNYMRTLEKIDANKLFILDDLGYDQRGGFYLGKNNDYFMVRAVLELVEKTKSDLSIDRTFYVGSSKGGFASLYFGMRDKSSTIICGGPQYLLGDHFLRNERYMENTVPYILGKNFKEEDVKRLNDIVRDVIYTTKGNNCKIYLHYSDKEYTYRNHVKPLIQDLKANGIDFEEDVAHYEKHPEIAYFFPSFLVNTLKSVLEGERMSNVW